MEDCMQVFYKMGFFKGSKNIDLAQLDQKVEQDKDGSVKVYNNGELVAIVPKAEVELIKGLVGSLK
jgi:hypothetical protein